MPVLWHGDRSSNLDKAQIFVVLLPFFKRPVLSSLQRRAGSGTDCPTIHFGGWKRPRRVEMSREGETVGVVPGAAGEGVQNRPPRTKSPSGADRVARSPSGTEKITLPVPERPPVPFRGVCVRCFYSLWRVYSSLEGGTVGVVPGTTCGVVQNRPPRTKSPSRYQITLRRGEGDKNTLQGRLRGWEPT